MATSLLIRWVAVMRSNVSARRLNVARASARAVSCRICFTVARSVGFIWSIKAKTPVAKGAEAFTALARPCLPSPSWMMLKRNVAHCYYPGNQTGGSQAA